MRTWKTKLPQRNLQRRLWAILFFYDESPALTPGFLFCALKPQLRDPLPIHPRKRIIEQSLI
jgi:hypothetical protein